MTNTYALSRDGLLLASNASLYLDGFDVCEYNYCHEFGEKDTVIIIKLDMDKKTICYEINDKQYETKDIPLAINEYRLAITMEGKDEEIELL